MLRIIFHIISQAATVAVAVAVAATVVAAAAAATNMPRELEISTRWPPPIYSKETYLTRKPQQQQLGASAAHCLGH